MPGNDPLQGRSEHTTPAEQFEHDRLDRESIDVSKYPAQVDRAAIDVLRGIAVGKTDDATDIGGTVDRWNFDEATGEFYVEGLTALAGPDSTLARNLREYGEETVGQLAFQLNSLRHTLGTTGASMDIDRALEALLEKTAAAAIESSVKSGGNEGAGLRNLRDTDSVSDLTAHLFSDPRVDAYAQALVDRIPKSSTGRDELVRQLDEARMTTPLWKHQREALERWHANSQTGYVDMATATGKTVLGLAALALRYGSLHPSDTNVSETLRTTDGAPDLPDRPRVLVVAGSDLLLDQWRAELDEHLDIPQDRTRPEDQGDHRTIELAWGDIEFRTTQALLETPEFSRYDLVILDEAHRYTRGSSTGRGWRDLFRDLTEGTNAILAMSGSVDSGWTGDESASNALEDTLDRCYKYDVAKARREGVIADFSWQVRYVPATGDRVDRLASQTRITTANYDSGTGTLNAEQLDVPASKLPSDVVDYDDLRSFVQSNDGSDLRSESTAFDAFASALLARKPLRWNTAPDAEPIASLVAEHAPEQKTVVLVRSYDAAEVLADRLTATHGIATDDVVAFTDSDDDRLAKIQAFNDGPRGVIIGPGDLLGTGVDMPDAEVAVNVSRGGVNASLVQRIGRVLRNPTGDKEAQFYHLVAQPLDEEAMDVVEDGAKLLERAAEFRAVGETFREAPTYRAHDDVAPILARLENGGVELLERVDDESRLVDDDSAREHLRTLQAAVYDAIADVEEAADRDSPALESWVSPSEDEGGSDTDRQFQTRNEAYERYRLSLGPYRAAKSVAKNRYGASVDIEERDGRWHVSFDDDQLSGTAFHEEFEQWLNSYRDWRDHCDNRNGDGEPGSLPEYKSEWPEPPEDKGVMLEREVVDEIGISYADADPIFFPYVDGDLYTLPLPDGSSLTVDGVVEESTPVDAAQTDTERASYTVDALLLTAARARDVDLEEFASAAVTDLLEEAIHADVSIPEEIGNRPRTELGVEISDRHERMLEVLLEDTDRAEDIDPLLDIAFRRKLDVDGSTSSVEIPGILADSIRCVLSEGESVDEFVADAVQASVLDALD